MATITEDSFIYKSNDIIKSTFRLSLGELKLVDLCAAKVGERRLLKIDEVLSLTTKELQLAFIDKNLSRNVRSACCKLSKQGDFQIHDNPKSKFFSLIRFVEESKSVDFSFSAEALPHFFTGVIYE